MLIRHRCFLCKELLHAHTSHNVKGHNICKRCLYPNWGVHRLSGKRYKEILEKINIEKLKRGIKK